MEYSDVTKTWTNCFGKVTFTYSEKVSHYTGGFKNGEWDGQGTYINTHDGSKYIGQWVLGFQTGQGIKTYADGTVEEGIWKNWEFQYAKKVTPPIPEVETPTQDDEIISASSGSGFAVSSDGYVITNHHVIDGCEKVVVHTKGKELPVSVVI